MLKSSDYTKERWTVIANFITDTSTEHDIYFSDGRRVIGYRKNAPGTLEKYKNYGLTLQL